MFIIVGHDKQRQQVIVRDTKDNSIERISYSYLQRAINKGLEVKGLDNRGNIMCQRLKIEDEILPQIKQLYAKALVLNATDALFAKMLLTLVKDYGLADSEQDIYASIAEKHIILKIIGSSIFLRDPYKTVNYSSIKLVDEFKQLDDQVRCMLDELVKIPFLMKGPEYIDYIIEEKLCVYYIKAGEKICRVSLARYNRFGHIFAPNHIFGRSPHLYEYYLEKLNRETPAILFFINDFIVHSLLPKDRLTAEGMIGKGIISGRLIYQGSHNMFVIVGNDPEFEKVKILDISDGREEWAFYKILRQGIKNGLAVAGLDTRGNIICQSLDVYKEIIKKSIPIRAKITLLKLDRANQMKLFLNLLEPYGLAQIEEDIQYSSIYEMLTLLYVGKHLDLQTGLVKKVSIGVYASTDKAKTPTRQLLVNELNQMIFDSDDTEIHHIFYIPKRDSYACIIGPRLYEVQLSLYHGYSSLEHTLQRYCQHMVHRVYYAMYIEDAWARQARVLIDKMELLLEAASFNQEVHKKMIEIIKSS